MATYAFDIYPANDPAGSASTSGTGSRLVRMTVGNQLIDGWYRHVGHGLGGGEIKIHADHADAAHLEKRGYVLFVRTDTDPEQNIGGFFLEEGEFDALSSAEAGGRVLTFGGPGALFILDRYVLTHEVHASGQTARGSYNVADQWTWDTEPYGAMLLRAIEEGQQHPDAFYEAVSANFTRTRDSNDNLWTDELNYETPIGTNVLDLYADFVRLGLIVQSTATLGIQAYRDIDEFRTDRTSATFTANKVRFEAGQNIASPLPRRLEARQNRSHVLIRDEFGEYAEVDTDVDGVQLPFPSYHSFIRNDHVSADSVITKQGQQNLTNRKKHSDQAVVRHIVGSGTGQYAPGPAGDYWVLDLVTLHTGTGEHDFNETAIEVAAIRFHFDSAGNPLVETELGAQYIPPSLARFEERITSTIRTINPLQLCTAISTTEASAHSWIPGDILIVHAASTEETIPTGATGFTGIGTGGTQAAGTMGSRMFYRVLQDGDTTVGSDWTRSAGGLACAIYRGQHASDPIGDASGTGGTGATVDYSALTAEAAGSWLILAGHHTTDNVTRTAPSGYEKRVDDGSLAHRHFLHDSDGIEASFAGASVEDGVAGTGWQTTGIELKVATGETLAFVQAFHAESGGDLPSQGAEAATTSGDAHADLVGTSVKATRCDHAHHVFRDTAPTVNDDEDDGYPTGTLWVRVNSLSNPTSITSTHLLIKNTAGAAEWETFGGGVDLTGVNFLVGTATGLLSGEIVAGTTPGGELGGTWASPTVDATHGGGLGTASHLALGTTSSTAAAGDHTHAAGGVGPILISDSHSVPLVFDDLLQNDDGDDLLYADI